MNAHLTALTWNPHIGRADELPEVLPRVIEDAGQPHVISLQEVWDWGGTVPGYRRVEADRQRFPHHEARSTILLVRKRGVRLRRAGARQVDGGVWIGPVHGRPHPPRVFPRATIDADGARWDVLGIHRCPGGPDAQRERNRQAWADEHRLLVDWDEDFMANHPHRSMLMLGDHNNRATDDHRLSVSGLASRIGGHLALERIDGAVVRDVMAARATTLPELYGSDHHPVVVGVVARRRRL